MADRFCPQCHEQTDSSEECASCGAPTVLESTWVLEGFVGHGASGYTWKARHVDTGEIVAIKELSFRKMTDLKQLELFEREAEALRSIEHPNVPRYRDQFVVEGDRFVSAYLVQEFIEGESLDSIGRVDEPQVRAWLLELSDTLEALHGQRPPIVHRDIKPSNVMRRDDGRLVLIDFGAIRAAAQASMGGSTIAGTMGYMAPEQLLGKAEPASDYYALGATAVALLAGRDASELIDPHEPGGWREHVDLSGSLADVLEAMLQPKPADRIGRPEALRAALEPSDEPATPPPRKPKSAERQEDANEDRLHGPAWAIAALYFGALAIGFVGLALVKPAAWKVFVATTATSVGYLGFTGLWLGVLTAIGVLALAGWKVPVVRTHPLRIWAVAAAAFSVGFVWWTHAPSRITHKLTWFGERDDELRRGLVHGDETGCVLVRTRADVDDVIGVAELPALSNGQCPELDVTEFGSMWLKVNGERPVVHLVDLWTGETLWKSDELDVDAFAVRGYAGEEVEIELPDGSTRTAGVQRSDALRDGMTKFVSVKDWVNSVDLPSPEGFRKSTFTRDSGCGALVSLNTTKFGPGEWRLAQVGPGFSRWEKSVRELTGSESLRGAYVGPDSCWLAAADAVHRLDPNTGETSDVLVAY